MDDLGGPRPPLPPTYAGFWPRVAARLVDLAVLSIAGLALTNMTCYAMARWHAPTILLFWMYVASVVMAFSYLAICTARTGQTPGKAFMGLQVQRAEGGRVSAGQAARRCAVDTVCMCASLVGIIDYLWVAWGPRPRALHDLAAGTVVRHIRPMPSTRMIVLAVILSTYGAEGITSICTGLRTGPMPYSGMEPTVRKGDCWAANRFAYGYRAPAVGDIVLFAARQPIGHERHVGRVVGVAGDHLAFRGGQVVRVAPRLDGMLAPDEVFVAADEVAVLGDNRATQESASFPAFSPGHLPPPPPPPFRQGPILTVETRNIQGQIIALTWPPRSMRVVR